MIFDDWQGYDRDVVPPGADAIQREECRRAFYAGAWACFCAVLEASAATDADEAERRVLMLQVEIQNVATDLSIP